MIATFQKPNLISILEKAGMTNSTKIVCRRCGLFQEEPIIKRIALTGGGFHNAAYCSGCGRYIQHIRHAEPVLYFGKYKGKLLSDIARSDPLYLRWLLTTDIKKGLRENIEESLVIEVSR